jgi:sialate O-acetylesterase
MQYLSKQILATFVLLISLSNMHLRADVTPSSMFGNNMILQRDMQVPVWGKAAPGEKITVRFAGQQKSAIADKSGKWIVRLDPLKASNKGLPLTISGKNKIEYKDVLVGEVWLCSGQSNMELGVGAVKPLKKLINTAKKKPIHTFRVTTNIAFEPQDEIKGSWSSEPPTSAVAFGFSYFLQKSIDVPVGIILTCWGSSSIEGWMPLDMTEQLPHFKKIMAKFQADKDQQELCKMIIDQFNKNGKIQKYSDDPEKDKKLAKKYRSANIYARTRPNMLYNAMLHPIAPYALRGMVWYQGEANGKSIQSELQYAESLQLWVKRLRKLWKSDNLHFLAVMLPGFGRIMNRKNKDLNYPGNITWAWLRESQMKVLSLPNTGVANTIDLGEKKNIHPKDKEPLCKRLALLAERDVYGEKIVAAGPIFESFKIDGNKMIIKFKNSKGLKTKDGKAPEGFWLAGKKRLWNKATAVIKGDSVVLVSDKVDEPVACRYAFAAMPTVNLVNSDGLPAYPFRTDDWKPMAK